MIAERYSEVKVSYGFGVVLKQLTGRRFWRWFWTKTPNRYESFYCPKCGREVTRFLRISPGFYTAWTEREILSRCPVDGWPPWNGPTVRQLEGDVNYPRK